MRQVSEYESRARLLKALSHPTRLAIVHGLLENECNVGKMQECLGLPQPTVSMHLKALKAEGIIEGVRKGTTICYKVVDERAVMLVEALLAGVEVPRMNAHTTEV